MLCDWHPSNRFILHVLCKCKSMLCRNVTVKKLHMSKQEAILYEHAKNAALQQMQASHRYVCQLSQLPCSAIASKHICSDMSFSWQQMALTAQTANDQSHPQAHSTVQS